MKTIHNILYLFFLSYLLFVLFLCKFCLDIIIELVKWQSIIHLGVNRFISESDRFNPVGDRGTRVTIDIWGISCFSTHDNSWPFSGFHDIKWSSMMALSSNSCQRSWVHMSQACSMSVHVGQDCQGSECSGAFLMFKVSLDLL